VFLTSCPDCRSEKQAEIELPYKRAFPTVAVPDAYEKLIYDALMGQQVNFVRSFVFERERERQRETETARDSQRQPETDRHADRPDKPDTHRQTDR
jgi:glucose-6-phosphate 1-dehydrogenase